MLYRVLQAVAINSSRVERGTVVDVDEVLASSIGADYLQPLENVQAPAPVAEEKRDLDSLTKQELVDLADKEGLSVSGTKADLIERLTLHYQESN